MSLCTVVVVVAAGAAAGRSGGTWSQQSQAQYQCGTGTAVEGKCLAGRAIAGPWLGFRQHSALDAECVEFPI